MVLSELYIFVTLSADTALLYLPRYLVWVSSQLTDRIGLSHHHVVLTEVLTIMHCTAWNLVFGLLYRCAPGYNSLNYDLKTL